jgi:hypothetical protein
MKRQVIVAAMAALTLGLGAHAQTMGRSDDYVCNHGDQDDPRTQEACARLRGAPGAEDTVAPGDAYREPRRPARVRPHVPGPAASGEAQPAAPSAVTSDNGSPSPSPANPAPAPGATAQPVPVPAPPAAPGPWPIVPAAKAGGPLSGGVSKVLILVVGGLAAILGLLLYMLPGLIAFARRRPNAPLILLVNFLLGWSFVGWIAALIWSLTTPAPPVPDPTTRPS